MPWLWTSDRYFICASGHWVTILLHGALPEQHTSRSAVAWIKTPPGMRECRSHTLPAWLMLAWPTVWPAEHHSKINLSPLSAGLQERAACMKWMYTDRCSDTQSTHSVCRHQRSVHRHHTEVDWVSAHVQPWMSKYEQSLAHMSLTELVRSFKAGSCGTQVILRPTKSWCN